MRKCTLGFFWSVGVFQDAQRKAGGRLVIFHCPGWPAGILKNKVRNFGDPGCGGGDEISFWY